MSSDVARALFNQVDTNRDGTIDRNEFNQLVSGGAAGGYGGASSYESSYSSSGYGAGAGLVGGDSSSYDASAVYGSGGYGAGAGLVGGGSSNYDASAVYSSGGYGAGAVGGSYGGSTSFESSAGYGAGAGVGGQGYDASSTAFSSQTAVQTYPTNAQGLFLDSNPQVIRRPAAGGVQTYTQNIRVRFLQPPPVPPPGPLIIKEVRPPQPPAPPPLRIRQQAPPLPQQAPLILRERPPVQPAAVASQTVIRRLAALPVPPRSVIIERLPPLPPRPRDIIIERWIPYGAQAKRRTVVQRAAAAQQYARPRNIIIQYEPIQVRIVRQFQRLGVTPANPVTYVQQYGASLLDAVTLLQQARSVGVVEDISPPAVGAAVGFSAANYSQEAAGGFSGSSFESSGYDAGVGGGFGLDAGLAGGASSYESSSYSASSGFGGGAGYGVGLSGAELGGGYQSSSFESSSYGAGGGGAGAGLDVAAAALRGVDTNRDWVIDRGEFNPFYQQGS